MRFESQLSRRNCQTFFLRVQLRALCRQGDERDVGREDQPAREMPAGLIGQHNGVRARRDLGGDFGQVQVHRLVSQCGMTSAAPLPSRGQIAPKI